MTQYNGKNNGDLCAAFSLMKKRGWKSKSTLHLALDELKHYGWIICTRTGGLNKIPNLYAITFKPIDECDGKLDVPSTVAPPGNWQNEMDSWRKPEKYKNRFNTIEKKSLVQTLNHTGTNAEPMRLIK